MLISNGYGSVMQKIIFTVPASTANRIKNISGFETLLSPAGGREDRSVFLWCRWTTRTGDDESIVIELGNHLSGITYDWQIDWVRSTWI